MAFQSVVTRKDGFGQPTYNSQYGFHVNPTIVTSPVSLYALRDDDLHMGYNIRPMDGTGVTPSDGLWKVATTPYTDFLTPVDSTKSILLQTVDDITFVRAWGVNAPNADIGRGTFEYLTGGDYLDSVRNIYADLKRTIPAPFYSPDFERMNGKSGTTALAEGFRIAGNVLVEGFTLGAFQGASDSNHIRPGDFFYDKYNTSKPLAATCLVDMIKYVDDRIEVVKKEAFVSGLIQAAAMAAAGKVLGKAWDAVQNVLGRRNRVRPIFDPPGGGGRTGGPPRLPTDIGPAIAGGAAAGLAGGLLDDLFDGGGGSRGRPGRDGEDGRDGFWTYTGHSRTLEPVYRDVDVAMYGVLEIYPASAPNPTSDPAYLRIGDLNNYVQITCGPQPDVRITTGGLNSFIYSHDDNEIHRLSSNEAGWTTSEYCSKLNGDCTLRLRVPGNEVFPVTRRCELVVSGETGAMELKNYSIAPTLFKNNSGQPWRFLDLFADPFAEGVEEVTMVEISNGQLTARNPGSTQLVLETTSLDQLIGMNFKRQGDLKGAIQIDNEGSMRFASTRDYLFYSVAENLAEDQRPRLYMHVHGLETKLESTPKDYYPFWTQDGIVCVESYRETPSNLFNFANGNAGLVCRAWREGRAQPTDGAVLVHPDGPMEFLSRKNLNNGILRSFTFKTIRGSDNWDTLIAVDDSDFSNLFNIRDDGRTETFNTAINERDRRWSPGDGAWYPTARHHTAAYFANVASQPITQDEQYQRPTSSVSVDLCVGASAVDPVTYPSPLAYASIWLHREKYGDSTDINGSPSPNYPGVPALNISVQENEQAIRSHPTLTIYDGVVEVKGNLLVTGSIQGMDDVDGTTTLTQNVTIDGTLTVNEEVVMNNDLTVHGDTTTYGDMNINGELHVTSLDVTGALSVADINCSTLTALGRITTQGHINCDTLRAEGNIEARAVLSTSDIRKKNIIGKVTNVLDKVLHIGTYDFTLKDDLEQGVITGLIAQEVETHFPQLVCDTDRGHKALNYLGLVPILWQAIQDLTAEVRQMQNTITNG